ncbi:uncharacterized protein LOC144667304 [Oculina patagonica]
MVAGRGEAAILKTRGRKDPGDEVVFDDWLAFIILCTNVVSSEDCEKPDGENIFQKSNCTGYQIAVHSVWTEIQCLDNCFRHPHCDKYIFDGQGDQNCKLVAKLVNGGKNPANLQMITGACAPQNITVLREFVLGTKSCSED